MTGVLRMKIAIRRMGNSRGVIIPKPVLARVGLDDEAEMSVGRGGAIILRKTRKGVREGWSDASKTLAASGENGLVWPESG